MKLDLDLGKHGFGIKYFSLNMNNIRAFKTPPSFSIIIPVINEAAHIQGLIDRLLDGNYGRKVEILVVDGGSTDSTDEIAKRAGARVLFSPKKGRAHQMNFGAKYASGNVFYFVHGDTLPPFDYLSKIETALEDGYPVGSFRLRLGSRNPLLKINSFMTRFHYLWCRGGDQSLYVTRKVFEQLGGYRDDYCVMEDYEFIERAWEKYPFKVLNDAVLASARKYNKNGYVRVQLANLKAFRMYRRGCSPEEIKALYHRLIDLSR